MIAMGTNKEDPVFLPHNGRFVLISTERNRVLDDVASLIIREDADKVMDLLLEKLCFPKLQWTKRYYRLRISLDEKTKSMKFSTIDYYSREHEAHYFLKKLTVTGLTRLAENFPQQRQPEQPFNLGVEKLGIVEEFLVQCTFMGQYNEPLVCIRVPIDIFSQTKSIDFDICFDVVRKEIESVNMINSLSREALGWATF